MFEKGDKDKISEKVARDQLDILMKYYDIELDEFEDDQKKAVDQSIKKLIKAIRRGQLEIKNDDELKVTQHMKKGGEPILYNVLSGKNKTAMANKKDTDYHGRIYAMLGSQSGLGETAIQSLTGSDLSVAESLGILFLQA